MKIQYLGHTCFRIQTQSGISIVTDPYGFVGFSMPETKADIVTASHGHYDHNNVAAVGGNPLVLDKAGKTQAFGITVTGYPCYHDDKKGAIRGANLAFLYEIDGLRLCHLGDLGEEDAQELINRIRPVDILLIPVGGNYTIDGAAAKRYAEKINPHVIIPMHYKTAGLNIDIAGVEGFLKQFAKSSVCFAGSQIETGSEDVQKENKKNYCNGAIEHGVITDRTRLLRFYG